MMVLIININYLVILICSTVFLLSSFVSSQQKSKNIEDPLEFYEYVLYLNAHYPDYYAKNYNRLNSHYKKLISAANAKVAKESPSNRGTSKRNLKQEPAVPRTTLKGDDFSRFTRKTSQDNNAGPFKSKSEGEVGKLHSRSLNSPETYANARREISDAETDWARNCLILGYNNTNGACQSEPEEIKQAPNQTICRSYFDFGCQYQSNRNLCVAAVNEVMKNISFNCDFNINGDSDLMSVQCCMACKSGMHTAIIKDSCNMHLDNSMPSFAQEKCCNTLLNPNTSDSTTELIKTGSLDEIFAHLEDRFSNSETDKSEIDGSTVPETSTLPTTTITTDTTTTPKPSTTTESNAAPSTTMESNAAPSTTMESNAAPSTTTTAIITELATMASNITAKSPILPETTTLEPTNTESTTRPLGLRSLDDEDSFHVEIPEGYRALEHQKNSYAKIDVKDKSKVDYLKILKKELVMKRSRKYKDFVLMDITQTNYSCDWEFKIEKAVAADDVTTLTEYDFEPKSEKEKFILLIKRDEIQPQTIQFSVACNLKEHKYFKYIVYLTIK